MSSTYQVRCFQSVIKQGVPSPYIFSQSYYNRQKILSVFMNMVHIFGVITEAFASNDSKRSKMCFPYYAFWRCYLFYCFKFLFQFQPIFICCPFLNTFPEKKSVWLANFYHPYSFMIFLHYHPWNIPNTDMVILYTYLTLDNKIEDTETHHIHNQA